MEDFFYDLPDEKIAKFPLPQRDASRLLVYKQGVIEDRLFSELPQLLPADATLVFNDTKVIPARLLFHKGDAEIEVFLLTPLNQQWTQWEVMVGNRRKFKPDDRIELTGNSGGKEFTLGITWLNREQNHVTLHTSPNISPMEAIELLGQVPLPPYLHRNADENDKTRYQTVFARFPGAVAAPTASLHFSETVMENLLAKGIKERFLTLHVGAGTFKPVTATTSDAHHMHAERFVIKPELLREILQNKGTFIPVGTTAMRLLESLYYMGAKILLGEDNANHVEPDVGYNPRYTGIPLQESLAALKNHIDGLGGEMQGSTSIYIMPGFQFKISKALITNFHQPSSTLLLLVAAFIGKDWKEIYKHALQQNYRFLSYGDSSLLWP